MIAMQVGGALLTADGWHTWRRVPTPRLRALWFAGGRYFGWTAANTLVVSTDGSAWSRVPSFSPPAKRASVTDVVDVDHLWATTQLGATFATSDGGRSWRRLKLPCDSEVPDSAAFAFRDARRGYLACGGEPGAGNQMKWFFTTHDGGQHWRRVRPDPPTFGYVGSLVVARGRIYLVADRFGYYVTSHEGHTWQDGNLVSDDADQIVSLSWPDATHGYALLFQLGLLRTVDGGRTWHQVYPRIGWEPGSEISFSSPEHGIGAGIVDGLGFRAAALVRTDDGGRTWRIWSSIPVPLPTQLVRTGPDTLWAIGHSRTPPRSVGRVTISCS